MSYSWKVGRRCLLVVSMCVGLGACALNGATHQSSNLVSYLYPNQPQQVIAAGQSGMVVPVRVGVGYVPEQGLSHQALTDTDKRGLQMAVAAYFEQQSFVSDVRLVPAAYLTPGGSFANLDQLRRIFDVDIMVLLSYDRTRFAERGPAVVSYWTLDGEQLISGEKNDTHTLLDAAVFDIGARQLLFRAPGSSLVRYQRQQGSLAEQLRQDSLVGFEQAGVELMEHLRERLSSFVAGSLGGVDPTARAASTPAIIPDTRSAH